MTHSTTRNGATSPRRLRRASVLAGVGLLATALTACSSGGDSSSSSSDDIVIGATGPLSGAQQDLSAAFGGMQAYIDQVNAQGGVGGHKLKFVTRDDQFDASKTPQQIRQLVTSDKVDLLCGNLGSDQLGSVANYITAQKVPSVALSGAAAYATPDSTIFEQLPSYGPLGAQVAQHVVQSLKKTKIAIAFTPDDIGEPFRDGATAVLKQAGLTPAATVQFSPANADQSTVAAQLKASGADVVLINHISPIVSLVTKAAAQIGYTPQWASTFALDATNMGQVSGGTLNGVYMSTPFILGDSPAANDYRTAITASSSKLDPNGPIVMEGWSTADVCVNLLKKAVDAASGKKPTRAQIVSAAEDFSLDDTYIHGLKWTKTDHTGQKQAQIIQFKDYGFSTVAPFAAMPDVSSS